MTLPDERTRAVIYARNFLRDLLDPKKTPRVPIAVRRRARDVLKHYPWDLHISDSSKKLPDVWGDIEDES